MTDIISILSKNYNVEKEIGRGGMGVVYLATDKRLDRKVAIKVLTLSSENDSASADEVVERFQREAKAIAKLSHRNIVNIHDLGEESGIYYMVMEFLDGKPLSSLIQPKNRFPLGLAINIGVQVCSALKYAHENGVVHRDIKPENIILSKKGTVKITDFGIAQLTKEQTKLTIAGSILGSIMYIPPEQLAGSKSVDQRADIYSLGITLYELISGTLPFEGDNISEIFMKILKEEPPKLSTFYSDIPEVLDLIISKALVKDADQRYQTAGEMGHDLAKLIDSDLIKSDVTLLDSGVFDYKSNISTLLNIKNNDSDISFKEINTSEINSRAKFMQTSLKKTSIDKTIIQILAKNSLWIAILLHDWKTEIVNSLDLEQLIKKVIEPSLYGKAFTGAIVINKSVFLFLYDGSFIGAVDINTGFTGETVFQSLPKNTDLIELKIANEDQSAIPIIITNIIDGKNIPLHQNLDSSLVNILQLMDNLSQELFTGYISFYTESNIYYLGYSQGQQLFFSSVIKLSDSKLDLESIIIEGIVFNAYNLKPRIAGPTVFNLMKNSKIILQYLQSDKSKLYDLVDMGNKEIPIHIIKETKQNTSLQVELPEGNSKLNLFEQNIDLLQVIKKSMYYRFSDWMVSEYFYLINSSGNINSLKYIYTWIPAVENFRFFETLIGEDGQKYDFSIVFHGQVKGEDYKKVLLLTRFGNGSKQDIEKFIEDSIQVKKKLIKSGDIGGAIYISTEEYDSASLKLFYERTVEPRKGLLSFGSLDKLTKYKGFVRMGVNRGFHLNLIEYSHKEKSFDVIAPLLK
ncbi:MAG: serine/threonine protein kinase [Candidatus Sericytochromatia bacterium]|nr:serine/threonine protein kinase [Candidatus Sericytochromatia bacterium]